MKRTFASNTLGKTPKTSNKQQGKKILNISFFFLGAILIGALSVAMMSNFETIWSSLKQSGIKAISKTVGTPMQRDENDNINVLLLGYGGAGHDGGFLTDSIIIASRNPEVGNISMFSIPRDLRVKYPTGGYGRINANFYLHLRKNNDDFSLALSGMAQDISKMLGISIPYYATIDFWAFKALVDAVGGIDITVPETIHDSTYPNEQNRGYITFHLDAGQQHLDGATALKYARSRHSTSDFSRSLRQQLILRGIKDKIIASGFNVSTANELYETYTEFVHTNISAQELLRTTQFLEKVGDFSSFGFTTHCSFSNFQRMNPACFLYTPPRDHFGGASVILPMDARSDKVEYYDEMQTFTRFITQHPQMVKENVSIEVINAIDKELAKEHRMGKGKFDQQLATKLKRYGFNVIETMERADSLSVSTLSINNLGDYTATIEALKTFVPDLQIAYNTGNVQSWRDENGNPTVFVEGADISLILGNDYLLGSPTMSGLVEKKFSFTL